MREKRAGRAEPKRTENKEVERRTALGGSAGSRRPLNSQLVFLGPSLAAASGWDGDLSSPRVCSLLRPNAGFCLFPQEAANKRGVGPLTAIIVHPSLKFLLRFRRKKSCFPAEKGANVSRQRCPARRIIRAAADGKPAAPISHSC